MKTFKKKKKSRLIVPKLLKIYKIDFELVCWRLSQISKFKK